MPRTPPSEWGALFNFAGGGLVHMELFPLVGEIMAGQTLLEWIAAQILQRGTHANRPSAATVAEGTEYYESDTKLRFKAVAGAWVDDGNGNGAGTETYLYIETTLTNDQIKALPTTPIDVIPAPGAGQSAIPIQMTLLLDARAGLYTNVDALTAYVQILLAGSNLAQYDENDQGALQTAEQTVLAGIMRQNVLGTSTWIPWATSLEDSDNQPLQISMNNGGSGDLTGGNTANTMRIQVTYRLVSTNP